MCVDIPRKPKRYIRVLCPKRTKTGQDVRPRRGVTSWGSIEGTKDDHRTAPSCAPKLKPEHPRYGDVGHYPCRTFQFRPNEKPDSSPIGGFGPHPHVRETWRKFSARWEPSPWQHAKVNIMQTKGLGDCHDPPIKKFLRTKCEETSPTRV